MDSLACSRRSDSRARRYVYFSLLSERLEQAMDRSMFRLYRIATHQHDIAVGLMSRGNWPYRRFGTCVSVRNLVLPEMT